MESKMINMTATTPNFWVSWVYFVMVNQKQFVCEQERQNDTIKLYKER